MKSMIFGIIGSMLVAVAAILMFGVQNEAIQFAWIAFVGAGFGIVGLCMPESFTFKTLALIALLGGIAVGGFWLVIDVFMKGLEGAFDAATSSAYNR
jgi:hypothetical protein